MYNKNLIIYLLLLIFLNHSIALQPAPLPFSARSSDLIKSQNCERGGWSCKDCYTLQSCGNDNIFKYQISCRAQFPDRPYCDPRIGRCVSDRHVCAEMKDPEFKCPDAGIYPDLTDCRRYISCRAKGEIGFIYSCLYESVYNPVVKRCITNSNCYDPIADCKQQFKTMPYNLDPSLYIVCRGNQKPLIKDCGNKMLEYDSSLLGCDFKCKEEGRFAHPTNKTLYYICVYNEYELVRMMGLCRAGTIFDEIYDTCVYDFDITTQLMEITTKLETVTEEEILETTVVNEEQHSEQLLETTTINNEDLKTTTESMNVTTKLDTVTEGEILETTVVNEEQNSEQFLETTTINNEDLKTTTDLINVTTKLDTVTEGEMLEATAVNEEQNSEHFLETTTIKSTYLKTTTENALSGQETSTKNLTSSTITTRTTINLEESDTISTTTNIEVEFTTNKNFKNTTNSLEESLESTEKNDSCEESIEKTQETDESLDHTSEESEEHNGN